MMECDSNKHGRFDNQKNRGSCNLTNTNKLFPTEGRKMTTLYWKEASVFDSTMSNSFLQAHYLDIIIANVLIYAKETKRENDLRKMMKIMEGLLSHIHTHPNKGTKNTFNEF
jgi:hypothetical protein